MSKGNIYTVGGTVQAGDGIYIRRQADNDLLALCQAGAFAYVLTARQMGKSSLMVWTEQQLVKEGVRTAIVDLTELGINASAEAWYLGLLTKLAARLKLSTGVVSWWQTHAHLSFTQRLTTFFQEVTLAEIAEPVQIFIDEIDSTLSLPFTDDFFAAIRYLYNARALDPNLRRLSFVLLGVATPGDLIADPKRTPFNIGQRVDLSDFTLEEAEPLAAGLGLPQQQATEVLSWILAWTGGHPYLTQRLCAYSVQQKRDSVSKADVEGDVAAVFYGETSKQDNNLQFVRDMLSRCAPDPLGVLTTYRTIHRGKRPVYDDEQSLVKSHLKLSGVVHRVENQLRVRNRIYKDVFDARWIKEHWPKDKLKPYQRMLLVAIPLMLIMMLLTWQNQRQIRGNYEPLDLTNFNQEYQIALANGEAWVKDVEQVAKRVACPKLSCVLRFSEVGYPKYAGEWGSDKSPCLGTTPLSLPGCRFAMLSTDTDTGMVSIVRHVNPEYAREYRVELTSSDQIWAVTWAGGRERCNPLLFWLWQKEPCADDADGTVAEAAGIAADREPVEIDLLTWLVSVWGHGEKQAIARFEESHPHITINRQSQGSSLEAYLDRSSPPDILFSDIGYGTNRLFQQNQVIDLTDLWQQTGLLETVPDGLQRLSLPDDKQYYLPMGYNWVAIYYNKTLFAQHQLEPPQTWDDFLQVCETLMAHGVTPLSLSQTPWDGLYWFDYLLLRREGADFYRDLIQGQARFDDPRVRNAFEMWHALLERGYFGEEGKAMMSSKSLTALIHDDEGRLSAQKAAMTLAESWDLNLLSEYSGMHWPSETSMADIGFFRFPVIDAAVPVAEIAWTYGYLIPTEASQKRAAMAFLTYMSSVEAQTALAQGLGPTIVPANPKVDPALLNPSQRHGLTLLREADDLVLDHAVAVPPLLWNRFEIAYQLFLNHPENLDYILLGLEEGRQEAAEAVTITN